MRISAKGDYAVRAMLELASMPVGPVKAEQIAERQKIPVEFLENIMLELRNAGFVRTQRGATGGYWIARPPGGIALGEILETVEGHSSPSVA
jgi:Rrf2 family protein